MLSKVLTAAVRGVKAVSVGVEVDITRGFPSINVVGLGDATVKEAAARIRSAIKNSGYDFPLSSITINLSPAWIRKKGSQFDLPMAVGILASSEQISGSKIDDICFIGELSLDGRLNRCNGILPMINVIRNAGIKKVIIPKENEKEGALFDDIEVYSAATLKDVCDALECRQKLNRVKIIEKAELAECMNQTSKLDFKDVKGQEFAKRAITAAVSGGHGILITGSPGTGKTMLAQRISGLMPEPDYDEIIEMTSVYSVAGLIDVDKGYISERPFRAVGPTITKAGLLGGGANLKLGEITLAHKGVLFLDEFYEIERNVLDSLRIPMETKRVSFTRNGENFIFPADFIFVAAANPCKCGYYGDPDHECICSPYEIERYRNRVSGPILDRIDISVALRNIRYEELDRGEALSSEEIRAVVKNARKRQALRYRSHNFCLNSQISDGLIDRYIKLDKGQSLFLKEAYEKLSLNPRGVRKIKKLARTIADLEDVEKIEIEHIAEALQYRERKIR